MSHVSSKNRDMSYTHKNPPKNLYKYISVYMNGGQEHNVYNKTNKITKLRPRGTTHACNLTIWEAEAGESL